MGFLKKQIKKTKARIKSDLKQRREAYEQSRTKARSAYFKTKEEQRIRLARVKATMEAQAKERRIKARYAPRPAGSGIGGFLSTQPSYFAKPKVEKLKIPKKRKKKRRKK